MNRLADSNPSNRPKGSESLFHRWLRPKLVTRKLPSLSDYGTNALVDELMERGDLWFAVMEYRQHYGAPDEPDDTATRALRMLADAVTEQRCNGCRQPRREWGPICGGMTQGDYTHFHSASWWARAALAELPEPKPKSPPDWWKEPDPDALDGLNDGSPEEFVT